MSDEAVMRRTVELAGESPAEDERPSPKVAAALVRDGSLVETAYRGELSLGEHAEYTLLERKLRTEDVDGTTLFTTLEPCTTRNPPKRPCADRVVDRGIARVVIGMLDPNPKVYERGVRRLREAGVVIDFYPEVLRELLRAENESFVTQFRASPALEGTVSFNFKHRDGKYALGHGDLMFQTHWSNAGRSSIHIYRSGVNIEGVGVVLSASSFEEIRDASAYDMTSRVQTPREGEFVLLKNEAGHFAALRVDDVQARSHGDPYDEVTITYRINPDGGPQFGT